MEARAEPLACLHSLGRLELMACMRAVQWRPHGPCCPKPFFCCTTVKSDEQCNIKRALADTPTTRTHTPHPPTLVGPLFAFVQILDVTGHNVSFKVTGVLVVKLRLCHSLNCCPVFTVCVRACVRAQRSAALTMLHYCIIAEAVQ